MSGAFGSELFFMAGDMTEQFDRAIIRDKSGIGAANSSADRGEFLHQVVSRQNFVERGMPKIQIPLSGPVDGIIGEMGR